MWDRREKSILPSRVSREIETKSSDVAYASPFAGSLPSSNLPTSPNFQQSGVNATAPASNTEGAGQALSFWADNESGSVESSAAESGQDPARGPFSPSINRLLQASFGVELQNLTASFGQQEANRDLGAVAHTVGTHISLGDGIHDHADDPHSIEAIGHEVAHALGGVGTEERLVSRSDDSAEHDAHHAGRELRRFVEGGGRGAVPSLRPAAGGRAVIHRLEGGEHVHAIDDAVDTLTKFGRPRDGALDPAVTHQMQERITLPNGLNLTPGMFSALMGDFYGRFRNEGGKTKLDPRATMAQMMSPDNREEMEQLIGRIAIEAETGKATSNLEFEKKTEARQLGPNPTDSFLDLAKNANETHYSGADPHGENNLGAYSAFHQMALEEAAKGDKADQNMLRAYEAASVHFLVDKHCAGHGIDKLAIQDAWTRNHPIQSKFDPIGLGPGGAVKILHDQGNRGGLDGTGIDVHNSAGETWKEFGDNDFANPLNAEGRRRSAESAYTSYDELEAVRTGKKTLVDVTRDGYGVNDTVPVFDPAYQQSMEEQTKQLSLGTNLRALNSSENWKILWHCKAGRRLDRAYDTVSNKVGQVWDGAVDLAHTAADTTARTAGNALNTATNAAGRAWDGATHTADHLAVRGAMAIDDAVHTTNDIGQTVWNGVTHTADHLAVRGAMAIDDAVNTTNDVAHTAWDGATHTADYLAVRGAMAVDAAVNTAVNTAGKAGGGVKAVGTSIWDGAGRAGNSIIDTASNAYHGAPNVVKNAEQATADFASQKLHGAKNLGIRAWDGAANMLDQGWRWAIDE